MPRFLAASDIHHPSGAELAWRLGLLLRRHRFDAVILAGDFLDEGQERSLDRLLSLIRRGYRGPVLLVWGNHEHYLSATRLRRGWNSLRQLDRLRRVAAEHGATVLDDRVEPVLVGGVAVIGSVGWYDYSYAPPGFTREQLETCSLDPPPRSLLSRCATASGYYRSLSMCSRVARNDCVYIRLPMPHPEYAAASAGRLEQQALQAATLGAPVVSVSHHAPRPELIREPRTRSEALDLAYAGHLGIDRAARRAGRLVAHVYGHLHERSRGRTAMLEGVLYVNAYPLHPEAPGFTVLEVDPETGKARVVVLEG